MEKEAQAAGAERGKYWRERVESWRSSGLTQKEYCEREGISRERLGTWKRRLDREAQTPPQRGSLVAVPPGIVSSALSAGRGMLGLVIRDQYRIEIPETFSPLTLEAVLQVLNRV